SAYSAHDASGLSAIFSSKVKRRGLAAGGCTTSTGRGAVLAAYRSQFSGGTGSYSFVGLSPAKVDVNGRTATVDATYSIGGASGSVTFTLAEASGRWVITKIYATCG